MLRAQISGLEQDVGVVKPYMIDTVRYVLYPLYQDCIRPRSRYSEIQYILYLLYLGPDTVDTACISPWSRYGG